MKFEYLEDEGITSIMAETDDICVICKFFDYCPLIGALETNLVYPSANRITIEECPIFAPEYDDRTDN